VSDITTTFAIVGAIVVLFVWDRLPVVLVALGTALALWATGILDLQQALGGLGDPTVIFIASLFVVSGALDATGVTAWAGKLLVARAGESRTRQLVMIMLLVAFLTALISVNGAVAALLPVVVVMAVRLGRPASQLLMPLVFAAHGGSMLAFTGTPVNVLVSEAATDAGVGPFGFFEFAWVGVPLLLGIIAIVILFGERLLPKRSVQTMTIDLSRHARTLIEHYRLDSDVVELRLRAASPWIGMAREAIDLAAWPGLNLVSVQGGDDGRPVHGRLLAEGDRVIVRGDAEAASRLAADRQLAFRDAAAAESVAETFFNRASGLAEVVIPPRSGLIGQTMFPSMITPSGDLVVLSVQRHGEELTPHGPLAAGDTLLLQGTWKALDTHLADPDVVVVDSPDLVRRQAVPLGAGSTAAIAVLLGMVVALATGALPPVVAGLLAACMLVLLGVVTVEQAYRSINWTTVILVGAMTPLSTAMTTTGAAKLLADGLIGAVGAAGPYALLAGLFVLTAVLGQLISNMATALIIIPIAVAAARELGISPRAVLMSVNVAAAAAFLTPVATPVNLMVMAPAGYHFGDYWKLGSLCLLWFFVVAVFVVPVFWPL